jgi:hypothetical protein
MCIHGVSLLKLITLVDSTLFRMGVWLSGQSTCRSSEALAYYYVHVRAWTHCIFQSGLKFICNYSCSVYLRFLHCLELSRTMHSIANRLF